MNSFERAQIKKIVRNYQIMLVLTLAAGLIFGAVICGELTRAEKTPLLCPIHREVRND